MKILEIIKDLDAYYSPSKPMSERLIQIYLEGLKDIDPNILDRVVREWIQEGKPFMPKIAELRAEAGKVHVDRYIDKRRVILETKDYYQTEDFTENENGRFRVTYRALKPREFDKVIAQ